MKHYELNKMQKKLEIGQKVRVEDKKHTFSSKKSTRKRKNKITNVC
jgi:hypothetical protein